MALLFYLGLGIALLVAELFVPGGVLGILGYLIVAYSTYNLLGATTEAAYLVGLVSVVVAVFFVWYINRLPETWIGKLFTLHLQSTKKKGYVSNDEATDLMHATGTAHSPLRPAGVAFIDGQYVDVVTEGDFIPAGTPIQVIRVVGGRTIVRRQS